MPDLFDEIKDELRHDRFTAMLRTHGTKLLAIVAAVVVVTGASSWYRAHLRAEREASGDAYREAFHAVESGDKEEAMAALEALIADGSRGYRELALLRKAALLAGDGKTDEAVKLCDALEADAGADIMLRNLAALRAAYLLLEKTPQDASLGQRLDALSGDNRPWRYTAREWRAVWLAKQGRKDEAAKIYAALAGDELAPPSLRDRAADAGTGGK